MDTKIVTIKSITTAATKAGKPMWQLETSDGRTNIFDAQLAKEINEKLIGKTVQVQYEQSGQYWNLKFIDKIVSASPTTPNAIADDKIGLSAKMKRKCEMMTVAKDIVLASSLVDRELINITNTVKVIWKTLMREIGEPIEEDEEFNVPAIEKK